MFTTAMTVQCEVYIDFVWCSCQSSWKVCLTFPES